MTALFPEDGARVVTSLAEQQQRLLSRGVHLRAQVCLEPAEPACSSSTQNMPASHLLQERPSTGAHEDLSCTLSTWQGPRGHGRAVNTAPPAI